MSGLLKQADKGLTDDPAFLFRCGDAFQLIEEILYRVEGQQVRSQILTKGLFNPQTFILAHQAGIDKYRRELIAHRFCTRQSPRWNPRRR